MTETIISLYVLIVAGKIVVSLYNIFYTKKNLRDKTVNDSCNATNIKNIAILIPVLREQSIIQKTLEHFKELECGTLNIHIIIAGTIREKRIGNNPTTEELVKEWIEAYKICDSYRENLQYYFFTANDPNGDRATQLNSAVDQFINYTNIKIDIIGVYDADSLPNTKTILEVVDSYTQDIKLSACQQAVHFVDASNTMVQSGINPIMVANAIYQSTWTMIRELPRWIQYYSYHCKHNKIYKRNIYLIGHGEFLTYKDYLQFRFPEHEVTDGIQLGYRLGMSNKSIKPILNFCSDDAPREISQLIQQHKRWFGGCMRLKRAYDWSKQKFGTKAIFQLLDGMWSQFSWAWSAPLSILFLFISLFYDLRLFFLLVTLLAVYCYIIPILAHLFLPIKIKVRLLDWLALPIAIALKAIGPNLYFFENILQKNIIYKKIERNDLN